MSHVIKIGTKISNEKLLRKVLKKEHLGNMSEEVENINLGYGNRRVGYEVKLNDVDKPLIWTKTNGFLFDDTYKDEFKDKIKVIENMYLKHQVLSKVINKGINPKIIKNSNNHIIIEYDI